jgi:polysaccharide pyruvyl transferase WcaK-like protein
VLPYIRDLDLFILGGGGILFDRWVNLYLREALLAQELEVPVFVYAVSAGPLEGSRSIDVVRDCLNNAVMVTVRDWASLRRLEEIGVRQPIKVTADPAFLLEPEPLPGDALLQEGLEGQGRLVGISVREPGPAAPDIDPAHYHALVANAADYMIARFDAHVLFVPMEPAVRDLQHAFAVLSAMHLPRRASVLRGDYSPGQLLSLAGHFDFAVGMRLHFLMFAAMQRVPFVALPYAPKVACLLEDLRMDSPAFRNVTVGELLAYIDNTWDRREAVRALVDENLPRMKERAGETMQLVLATLRRGLPGREMDVVGSTIGDAGR